MQLVHFFIFSFFMLSLMSSSHLFLLHTSHNALFVQGVSYGAKHSRVSQNYGHILSTQFLPALICFTRQMPVTQQDRARNTCVCSVYDMTDLLYESDGRRVYSECRNLPPSANKANESSWTQHNIPGNSQVFGRKSILPFVICG